MEKHQILVIEDHALTRKNLGAVLRDEGFVVTLATDGQEAVELLVTLRPDLILTDIMMPRLGGVELLTRLQGLVSGVPVIVLTATIDPELWTELQQHGARDYLLKPFDFADVLAKVREALGGAA